MSEVLQQQLTVISVCYEEILEKGQNIFECLKKREMENIQRLQGQQFKAIQKLENLQDELVENILQLCSQFYITEPRIRHLISYLEGKERDEIQRLYQQIINLDKEVRVICEKNGEFLKITLDLSENVIGWLSEYNEEHSYDSQLFIDETL